jgi:hypothetical protein
MTVTLWTRNSYTYRDIQIVSSYWINNLIELTTLISSDFTKNKLTNLEIGERASGQAGKRASGQAGKRARLLLFLLRQQLSRGTSHSSHSVAVLLAASPPFSWR